MIGPALSAAWQYLWPPLLTSMAIGWGAGACYDLVQLPTGRRVWSSGLSFREVLLGAAAPALLILAGAQGGAVPPSIWGLAPYASAAGFVATLAVKLLADRRSNPNVVKLVGLGATIALLGTLWVLAPRSDVPATSEQLALDHRLEAAIPLAQCTPRPIAALPAGLLRNSLTGLVRCHQGRLKGTFMAFRDSSLLDIYVAHREQVVDRRSDRPATWCKRHSGSYTGDWFKGSHRNHELGRLICFGRGRRHATVQWTDERSNLFASLSGKGRNGLYHWWHLHQVAPAFRR